MLGYPKRIASPTVKSRSRGERGMEVGNGAGKPVLEEAVRIDWRHNGFERRRMNWYWYRGRA